MLHFLLDNEEGKSFLQDFYYLLTTPQLCTVQMFSQRATEKGRWSLHRLSRKCQSNAINWIIVWQISWVYRCFSHCKISLAPLPNIQYHIDALARYDQFNYRMPRLRSTKIGWRGNWPQYSCWCFQEHFTTKNTTHMRKHMPYNLRHKCKQLGLPTDSRRVLCVIDQNLRAEENDESARKILVKTGYIITTLCLWQTTSLTCETVQIGAPAHDKHQPAIVGEEFCERMNANLPVIGGLRLFHCVIQ